MKIGELARRTGCKVVTIRYYEKEGLLPAPPRSEGNYRRYGEADGERLVFIRHCREYGMSLEDIRALLDFRDHPQRDCAWVDALIARHIDAVEAKIRSLDHLKGHLRQLAQSCSGGGSGETCGIMRGLSAPQRHCAECEALTAQAASFSGKPCSTATRR
jgi:Cd(II)/Pb(II)-responsive transcriptional regulator